MRMVIFGVDQWVNDGIIYLVSDVRSLEGRFCLFTEHFS